MSNTGIVSAANAALMPGVKVLFFLKVECNALTECPIFERHKRGKNWCATINRNPEKPGGLARDFWKAGHGEFYYVLPDTLTPGTALEFGADYYTASSAKKAKRKYAVVLSVEEFCPEGAADMAERGARGVLKGRVILQPFDSGAEACNGAARAVAEYADLMRGGIPSDFNPNCPDNDGIYNETSSKPTKM